MPDGAPSARRRLLQFGALGVVGGVVTWILLGVFDQSVRPLLVVVLVLGGALLSSFAVIAFERQPEPIGLPRRRSDGDEADARATRYTAELESLERRIDAAMTDPVRFRRILTPLLTDLAAQRLRSRRNLDLRSDDARQLLGDDLWRTMISSAPLPSRPDRAQLTEWIGRIELI